jgi:hypothetical protein
MHAWQKIMLPLNTYATLPKKRTQVLWVKDEAGNEFLCAMDAHKNPKNGSKEELKNCIVDAKSPQPFAGGWSLFIQGGPVWVALRPISVKNPA